MTENEGRLQAQLDEHPDDAASRLVLADLLEEQGQDEAARCQRWLAEQRKWPDNDLKPLGLTGWHWWSLPEHKKKRVHAVLPPEVQAGMPPSEWLFKTRAEAEAALARALAKVGKPPARQAKRPRKGRKSSQ
jgi:uncharacterized protein (TIGR02996 family)